MTRRRVATTLALIASLAALLAPAAAPPALAAGSGLTIVGDATYVVDPDNAAVHVTVDLTAVNRLKDTKTRLYFFDRAFLAVPPNTSGFKISARNKSSRPSRPRPARAGSTPAPVPAGKPFSSPASSARPAMSPPTTSAPPPSMN